MADHLKAVDVLKTITIKIMSNSNLRIRVNGFNKDVNEHVCNEYYEKTLYICQRYCPEVMED
tara:strand:- start:531 stop:716 length:186 start_codon:yes stop_codon:yes gene_type:complete